MVSPPCGFLKIAVTAIRRSKKCQIAVTVFSILILLYTIHIINKNFVNNSLSGISGLFLLADHSDAHDPSGLSIDCSSKVTCADDVPSLKLHIQICCGEHDFFGQLLG